MQRSVPTVQFAKRSFLLLAFSVLLLAACRLPDFPTGTVEEAPAADQQTTEAATEPNADANSGADTGSESGASEEAQTNEADADKQAGVAAAAEAATESDTEAAEAEVAEAPAEAAPAVEDWLTVTTRAEHELPAIGNPDAALTITEFSDFM